MDLTTSLFLHECQGVDDGEELTDVVRAVHGTEVEHLRTRLQVDGLIFHRPGIARAGSVDSPGIGRHFRMEWQHRVVAVGGRIL